MNRSTKQLLFERMVTIGGMKPRLDEALILENTNAAKKYLEQMNMGVETPEGKKILDTITNITRGDGYTLLLTKFLVNDKLPIDDIKKIHDYIKNNKQVLKSLPKEASTYDSYRNFKLDVDKLEDSRIIKKLFNELDAELKNEYKNASPQVKQQFNEIARKYDNLDNDIKKQITSKIKSFKQIEEFNSYVNNVIDSVATGSDIKTVYEKVKNTEKADIVHVKDNILIANIRSFEASQTLGCTSSWCITRNQTWYNNYRKGGKYFFFIWDFNYPSSENEYLVGTAFNPQSPERSETFVKDNIRTSLAGTIDSKGLDMSILSNYVEKHKEEAKMELEKLVGEGNSFLGLVVKANNGNENAMDALQNLIATEMQIDPDNVVVSTNYITFENKEDFFSFIDLDTESYDYIYAIANAHYYNNEDFYNLDDKDAEISYLMNSEIEELFKTLARHTGLHVKYKDDDWGGGTYQVANFLKDIGKYDEYMEKFGSEYDNANTRAKQNHAEELISNLGFDDEGAIELSTIINKAIENNENYTTFTEFTQSLPVDEINYDAMYGGSENVDYDELFSEMTSFLNDIESDLDSDDSQVYKNAQAYQKIEQTLKDLGFNLDVKDSLGKLETEDRVIEILQMDEDMAKVKIYYKPEYYHENGLEKPTDKTGNIKPENLVNYVKQMQLPLKEHMREKSKQLLMERMRIIAGLK